MAQRIVIVGGGFGGVTAALHLARQKPNGTTVTLISDKPWLEYYGVLYRLIGGKRLAEACIPLALILKNSNTKLIIDTVRSIDPVKKQIKCGSASCPYDTLVLSPGSVPAYFSIPGMEEHAITMKSSAQAIGIRKRVEEQVRKLADADEAEQRIIGRFAVVGAGPTGIEIAGEILALANTLLAERGLPASLVSVDLIEAMDRLLPNAEENMSARIHERLRDMGAHVHLDTAVARAGKNALTLKNGERIEAETLIWTAGVKASPLPSTIPGIELDKRGRVAVDEHLRAKGLPDIFVLGDCATTPYAGTAQTAVGDGVFAARVIVAAQTGAPEPVYAPAAPAYAIPAGPRWAAVAFGPLRVYGLAGYLMRRAADLHVYSLILPWYLVPAAFFGMINLERHGITAADTGAAS